MNKKQLEQLTYKVGLVAGKISSITIQLNAVTEELMQMADLIINDRKKKGE